MIELGGEFQEFIKRQSLPSDSQKRLIEVSQKLLARTDLIGGNDSANCQLVVGEVQSGKTMSFTALIALAHENGFPLVIVLAGTKNQLLDQTADRLKKDLRADGDGGANPWILIKKLEKRSRKENIQSIQKNLAVWTEKDAPKAFKPTVVITCLKNRESLDEIGHVINALNLRFKITDYPVLIIDDEGDQAGLNLRWAEDDESPVYAAINRVRKSLPKHSYVMYTATPQGPLLIGIQDALSPKYVTLLQSGDDYLGGEDLFPEDGQFVKYIPNYETPQVFDVTDSAPIPNSLKESLAFYLLALYVAQSRALPKPISMLIHPSARINMHDAYEKWVTSVLNAWESILREPTEQIYEFEKKRFFEPALHELRKTAELPQEWDLDSALQELRWWISKIETRVINSKRANIKPDEWKSKAGWIVIGGNNLERGFTIENLAVTFMPRSTGGGNVDVIQQRGRFFGYKRKYVDLLRGWFFQDNAQAFVDYVSHEKSIRTQLREIDQNDGKLSDWRRRFLLDPAYNPVRKQIISLGIIQKRLSTFKQQMLFDPILPAQRDIFLNRIYSLTKNLVAMSGDNRIGTNNYFCKVSLDDALELLVDWPMASDNRAELDDMLWALQCLLDDGHSFNVALVLMDWDPRQQSQHTRDRSMLRNQANSSLLSEEQAIANIFQGPSSSSGGNYPGDSAMFIEDTITIQVHRIRPIYINEPREDVVALALFLPKNTAGFVAEYPVRRD